MSLLGIVVLVFFSFWWIDNALKNWKKEQELKLDEIKNTVDRIETLLEDSLN